MRFRIIHIANFGLTWSLDISTGELKITGSGEMNGYEWESPWNDNKGKIRTVSISNGIFSPNGQVSREQLSTFFYAYAKNRGYDVYASANLGKYTDSGKISSWAKTAMQWAIGEGLISGTSDTTLSPKTVATRAQAAVIFKNFVEVYVAKQK